MALHSLAEIIQNRKEFSLIIVCSTWDEEKNLIVSKLHLYRRPFGTHLAKCRDYLEKHFFSGNELSYQQLRDTESVPASFIDPKRSYVRIVSSSRAGMGKSLFITRMAEKLQALIPGKNALITIPVHGPVVTTDSIMDCLLCHENTSECVILHFDISPSVLSQSDTILFSLLIQGGLCDSQGRVWRNHPSQLYAIEVTIPETCEDKSTPEYLTLQVLEMLPTVDCVKPKIAYSLMSHDGEDFGDRIVMNRQEFESDAFQRVYQYLRRHTAGNDLDKFSYKNDNTEGTPINCLEIFLNLALGFFDIITER
jgi:hypothetical protein